VSEHQCPSTEISPTKCPIFHRGVNMVTVLKELSRCLKAVTLKYGTEKRPNDTNGK
jgi:hypothetical protein